MTAPEAAIAAAWASPSEGACTQGTPIRASSCFEVAMISGVTREEARACLYASSWSPRARAASHWTPASRLTSRRLSIVSCFRAGGLPSKIYTGRIPFSRNLSVRKKTPERWEVILPSLSISGVPSGWRMIERNW